MQEKNWIKSYKKNKHIFEKISIQGEECSQICVTKIISITKFHPTYFLVVV